MAYVSYDEFLFAVRGEVNERRSQVILQAFEAMDKNNSGAVDSQDLKVSNLATTRFSGRVFVEILRVFRWPRDFDMFVGILGLLLLLYYCVDAAATAVRLLLCSILRWYCCYRFYLACR